MRHVNRMLLVLGLMALPAAVSAQGPGGPGGRGMMMRGNPVAMILEHKADLSLTDQQVTKLQDIQKKLEEKNKPLREQMQKETNGASFRDLTDEQREKLRPVFEDLRENSRKAMDEVREVLTPEQQKKMRDLMPMRRGPRGERGRGHQSQS
ncbi:MAG TPA: Spy/CpxP family protein refolding chaperone [Longimicrobiales bacterium]|nr:Spy/CpxP family protein refolding chaperone [Longimicrobiales bacterium]